MTFSQLASCSAKASKLQLTHLNRNRSRRVRRATMPLRFPSCRFEVRASPSSSHRRSASRMKPVVSKTESLTDAVLSSAMRRSASTVAGAIARHMQGVDEYSSVKAERRSAMIDIAFPRLGTKCRILRRFSKCFPKGLSAIKIKHNGFRI